MRDHGALCLAGQDPRCGTAVSLASQAKFSQCPIPCRLLKGRAHLAARGGWKHTAEPFPCGSGARWGSAHGQPGWALAAIGNASASAEACMDTAHSCSLAGGTSSTFLLSEVLGSAFLSPIIAPCSEQNGRETKSHFQVGSTGG